MRRLLAGLTLGLALTWGFGQVVRDATHPGQVAFYLPTPLVAAALLFLALLCLVARRTRQAAAWGLAALVPLTFVALVEHRWTHAAAPVPTSATLRVVHWNVRHGRKWKEALPVAVGAAADLYAFSEPPYGREREVAQALGFSSAPLRVGQVSVLARGRLGRPEWLSGDALQAVLVPWHVDGADWSVLLADLPSDLRVARDPLLARLRALVVERKPDVVLGDLNAPRRSRALTPPPPGFVHAYDAAGSGWSATWPVPVPLWPIDQCLVGPRLQVVGYGLRGGAASDHRMQVIDLLPRGRVAED